MIDFRRDNANRLRDFNENSVNDDNLKQSWTVGNNMPITLTVITLDYKTKCGEVSFSILALSVTFSAFIFAVEIYRRNGVIRLLLNFSDDPIQV